MRWEDERYVKLFTRDTLTTRRLGWEGRAVLWELFRKVDRVGIAEIGDEPPEEALAGLTGIPAKICKVAWPRLSGGNDPVVTLRDKGASRALFIPNFMPAQEAKASDTARKQKQRETARSREMAGLLSQSQRDDVTPCDDPSQDVTKGHDLSRGVTPSLAVPSLDPRSVDRSKSGECEGREFTGCESVDNSVPTPVPKALSESEKAKTLAALRQQNGPEAIRLLAGKANRPEAKS